MLDPSLLRDMPEELWRRLERRGEQPDRLAMATQRSELGRWRGMEQKTRERKNRLSAEIGRRAGGARPELHKKAAQVSADLKTLLAGAEQAEKDWRDMCLQLPNLPDDCVPDGLTEEHNRVLSVYDRSGEARDLDWRPEQTGADHRQIAQSLGMYHAEEAAAMSGARFAALSGPLAKLHRALGQFFLAVQTEERGYLEHWVPWLLHPHAVEGVGQLPKFAADLFTAGEEHYLLSTGEVPLMNLRAGQILATEQLPARLCALTPCFRSEAGSYGRDTKGLIRQHQFEKVEIVQLTEPENSDLTLMRMVEDARLPLLRLGLPHRVVELCAGELSFSAARTLDIEVWMPGQQQWRELSSCSNCRDFQARRLKIRCRGEKRGGRPELVHTLNGSALPLGRSLAAVLENCWDGRRLNIPAVLGEFEFAAAQ